MASETIPAPQFPHGTSRYTVAMAKCLGSLPAREAPDGARGGSNDGGSNDGAPNRTVVLALINLVQGRMLEYLADRICREYDIQDGALRQRIVSVLLGIFSDEFFALFRTKIEFQPNLVVQIARRIIRKELHPPQWADASPVRQPADRLYPALFRKYFEYRSLGTLLELVESDAHIQKIIVRNVLKRQLGDAVLHQRILQIMEEDRDGVAPSLLMGYLRGNDLSLLVEKVRTGAWKPELAALKAHMAELRGE